MSGSASAEMNPFPGLRPFREDEAHLFFGRESQVDAMVNKLGETHFLAVVGTSGSGKSSLVNCGLRPALRQGLMAKAGTAWRMAQFRPGSDPIGAMARALAQDGVLFRDRPGAALSLTEIVETTLRMSKLGLIDIFEQAALDKRVNLLVVVDQFEELFRYRNLGGTGREGDDAAAFVNLLLEINQRTTFPIFVVLTMRSDFLGDCTHFPGLAEAINAGQYLTPRLTRDERRAAIEGPVLVGQAEITSTLVTRLVNDVGDNPDQLSILQHALNRTWARWQNEGGAEGPLGLPHYEAIGTMASALDQHAEKAFAELSDIRKQQICEKLFKALTDKATDPRGVRRPTPLGMLCALADATLDEVTEVLDVFRRPSRSFVMPPAGDALEASTIIDISHESLMRVWQRLIKWADEEAQSARTYRRLAETADLHAAGKANLLRDPELQLALDWRESSHPNETWAVRYHPRFETAMRFLTQSGVAREVERQDREHERRRQLEAEKEKAAARTRTAWRMGVAAGFSLLAALIAIFFGWQAREASRIAEASFRTAEDALSKAQLLRWRAVSAAKTSQSPSTEILLALEFLLDAEQTNANVESAARIALAEGIRGQRELAVLKHPDFVRGVAITPDATRIVTGSEDGTARVWDALTGAEGAQLKEHTDYVRSVAVTPDGTRIVTGSDDMTARVWDGKTGHPLLELKGHADYVRAVAVSQDGTRIVTASDDDTARVWDGRSGRQLLHLKGHADDVRSVAITPDGTSIVTGSDDMTARVWDGKTGKLRVPPLEHKGFVRAVAVTTDGSRIVTGSDDNVARVWDLQSKTAPVELRGHSGPVTGVAITPDGNRVITGSGDNSARVWNARNGYELFQLNAHASSVSGVAVTSDGTRVVTGSEDNTARIWDSTVERPSPPSVEDRQALIERGKAAVHQCLTIKERQMYWLALKPPGWCIDLGKEPYDAAHWKAWKAGRLQEAVDADTAEEFGNFADAALRSGDFQIALEAAQLGLIFDPSQTWIKINLAHAYMFLGQTSLARDEYRKNRGVKIPQGIWEDEVVTDFGRLRDVGRDHPLMKEIEAELKAKLPAR